MHLYSYKKVVLSGKERSARLQDDGKKPCVGKHFAIKFAISYAYFVRIYHTLGSSIGSPEESTKLC